MKKINPKKVFWFLIFAGVWAMVAAACVVLCGKEYYANKDVWAFIRTIFHSLLILAFIGAFLFCGYSAFTHEPKEDEELDRLAEKYSDLAEY